MWRETKWLSCAMIVDGLAERTNEIPFFIESRNYAEAVFGELDKIKGSDMDPAWMVRQMSEDKKELQKIFLACGTEDFLLEANHKLCDTLQSVGAELTYEEGHGGHEWDFWNQYIKKVVDWLPLEKEYCAGMNSGNVGF